MDKATKQPPTRLGRLMRNLTGATNRTEKEWRIIVALVLFMALFTVALLICR